jgi:ABC-type microcin C transport system duplicated ATPase subunit YejF
MALACKITIADEYYSIGSSLRLQILDLLKSYKKMPKQMWYVILYADLNMVRYFASVFM